MHIILRPDNWSKFRNNQSNTDTEIHIDRTSIKILLITLVNNLCIRVYPYSLEAGSPSYPNLSRPYATQYPKSNSLAPACRRARTISYEGDEQSERSMKRQCRDEATARKDSRSHVNVATTPRVGRGFAHSLEQGWGKISLVNSSYQNVSLYFCFSEHTYDLQVLLALFSRRSCSGRERVDWTWMGRFISRWDISPDDIEGTRLDIQTLHQLVLHQYSRDRLAYFSDSMQLKLRLHIWDLFKPFISITKVWES